MSSMNNILIYITVGVGAIAMVLQGVFFLSKLLKTSEKKGNADPNAHVIAFISGIVAAIIFILNDQKPNPFVAVIMVGPILIYFCKQEYRIERAKIVNPSGIIPIDMFAHFLFCLLMSILPILSTILSYSITLGIHKIVS